MGVINASNVFLIFMVRVINPCKTPTIRVIVVALWKGNGGGGNVADQMEPR